MLIDTGLKKSSNSIMLASFTVILIVSCSETTANNMRKKGKPNPDQR